MFGKTPELNSYKTASQFTQQQQTIILFGPQ